MVDAQQLFDVLPHYAVVLVLIFLSTAAVRTVLGEANVALEFIIVMGIVAVYVVATRRLGYAPDQWT